MRNTVLIVSLVCAICCTRAASADEMHERQKLTGQVASLFFTDNFAGLEALADEFRMKKTRSASGIWKLTTFYYAFPLILRLENKDEKFWDQAKAISAQWVQQFPNSPTSHIARGIVLKQYAWKFRGGGYAHTVDPAMWPVFRSKLAEAREYLVRHKKISAVDPQWYDTMADIAMAEGWNNAEFEKLVDEGLRVEALYYQLYFTAVAYYSPKWRGDAEQIEKFANAAVKRTQKDEGFGLYARIYWAASQGQYGERLFRESSVAWNDMKRGIHDVLARYPDQWNINNFASFACLARDRAEAQKLIGLIVLPPSMVAWKHPDNFNRCATWAGVTKG